MNKWFLPVMLVALGLILAALSVPDLVGIASGILLSVSAIVPLRRNSRNESARTKK